MTSRAPRIALIWTQFAPYHVDRCLAVAQHFDRRAQIVAVEVASASTEYAWTASGQIAGVEKRVLFPDRTYEAIGVWRRFRAQFAALRDCDTIIFGIRYSAPDIIALSFLLRLLGKRTVMCTDSKFDDRPRHALKEVGKALLLTAYRAAIVAGRRQEAYVRFLGFRRRPVVQSYDVVSVNRVRAQAPALTRAPVAWAGRPFLFVGRFVEKKALPFLIDAYTRYVQLASQPPRRLVLIGAGDRESTVRASIERHGLDALVDLPGFLQAPAVAAAMADALALLLPSDEEQWGLVVNEATALGLPVICTEAVGARDTLVRNLVNGYVVENGSSEGFARAMLAIAEDEMLWRRMAAASTDLAAAGDAPRFAEAVEQICGLPG